MGLSLRGWHTGSDFPGLDLLAKFRFSRSTVSWGLAMKIQRDIVSADLLRWDLKSAIHDVDVNLARFAAGWQFIRAPRPSVRLSDFMRRARVWMPGRFLSLIGVDVIEHFLSRHAGSCYSGSGTGILLGSIA